MTENDNLSSNYVINDQVVTLDTQNRQQRANNSDAETITVDHNVNSNTQTQQTALRELPQTGINTQNQPPFMMISVSLFLIATGILLGFYRRGGEA